MVIGLDGMPIDRSHPLWDALEDDSVTPEEFAVKIHFKGKMSALDAYDVALMG